MAIDVMTVILTAVCTGIGISIGNGLYDIYFKDYLRKLRKQNERLRRLQEARFKKLRTKLFVYKRPWLAALLNIFIWGTGYFYVKRRRILGTILLLVQIFILGGYIFRMSTIAGAFEGVSVSFLTMIVGIYLGVDAYRLARQANAGK